MMRGTGTASSGQQDSKEGELFSNRVICLAVLLLSRHHSHTVLFVRASEGSLDWLPQVMTPSPADTVGGCGVALPQPFQSSSPWIWENGALSIFPLTRAFMFPTARFAKELPGFRASGTCVVDH